MALCKCCALWSLAEDDVYCGWCGAKAMGCAVTLEPDVLFLGSAPTDVRLTIANLGQTPLHVRSVGVDQEAQKWVEVSGLMDSGQVLQPDAPPLVLHVQVKDFLVSAQSIHTATISVTTGDSAEPQRVVLQVMPKPKWRVHLDDCEVLLEHSSEVRHAGRVTLETGYVRVEQLVADVPWVRLEGLGGQTWPCQLGGPQARELAFEVIIDTRLLRRSLEGALFPGVDRPTQARVLVQILCQKPVPLCEHAFTVTWKWPPELYIADRQAGALRWKLLPGKRQTVTVPVENRGGLNLEISRVELQRTASWLPYVEPPSLPVVISGGQKAALSLTVHGASLTAGTYTTALILVSNSSLAAEVEVPVEVVCESMPVYDGFVAFDFGTTNSCVVVYDPNRRAVQIVSLDDGDEPFIPSAILYQRLLDERTREYEVGLYAKSLAPLRPESVVQSVKRLLGMRRRVPVLFQDDGQRREYRPEEVAQDIIARLIERVEERLGKKIGECAITHPSTFSPVQLEALKGAFMGCGVTITMMLHEPVAAALDYILNHEAPESSYTLMVYDFGGGTIDITLLEVHEAKTPQGGRVITPRILGVDGRRWFGGDDVTEVVAQDLCRQFNEWFGRAPQYKRTDPNNRTDLIHIDLPAIDAMAEADKQMALSNRAVILGRAERVKIQLSNDPDPNPQIANISENLRFVYVGEEKSEAPTAQFSGDLLNKLIRSGIAGTIDVMQALLTRAKLERPDIILLSGQSSRLRLVGEMMKEHFTAKGTRLMPEGIYDGNLRTSGELKECVAKGACTTLRLLRTTGRVRINPAHMPAMATARLGIESTTTRGEPCFQAMIEAWEPVGTWKPIKGLFLPRWGGITILENTGTTDDLEIVDAAGQRRNNPEIEVVGTYYLSRELPPAVTDEALDNAQVEMMLTAMHEVILRVNVCGTEYEFTMQRWSIPAEGNNTS